MYKEVLSGIEGIGVYPAFSFLVFFLFFLVVATWLIRSKKSEFETVSKIPLSDEHNENSEEHLNSKGI